MVNVLFLYSGKNISKQMSFDEFVQTLPSGVVGVTQSANISEINAVLRNAKSISSCLGPQGLAAYAKPDLLANSAAKFFTSSRTTLLLATHSKR